MSDRTESKTQLVLVEKDTGLVPAASLPKRKHSLFRRSFETLAWGGFGTFFLSGAGALIAHIFAPHMAGVTAFLSATSYHGFEVAFVSSMILKPSMERDDKRRQEEKEDVMRQGLALLRQAIAEGRAEPGVDLRLDAPDGSSKFLCIEGEAVARKNPRLAERMRALLPPPLTRRQAPSAEAKEQTQNRVYRASIYEVVGKPGHYSRGDRVAQIEYGLSCIPAAPAAPDSPKSLEAPEKAAPEPVLLPQILPPPPPFTSPVCLPEMPQSRKVKMPDEIAAPVGVYIKFKENEADLLVRTLEQIKAGQVKIEKAGRNVKGEVVHIAYAELRTMAQFDTLNRTGFVTRRTQDWKPDWS